MNLLKAIPPAIVLAVLSTLSACRSSQSATAGRDAAARAEMKAEAYRNKVTANAQRVNTLTARVKLNLNLDGRDLSAGGSLRMKRDDVVQLSVSFLGAEIARLEFSPRDVLLIDRFNKQYVRAAYDQIDFLRNAGLDFHAVQALFWNELFLPGNKPLTHDGLARFGVSSAGDHTLLSLTDAPELEYLFLTVTKNAAIDRLTVRSKNPATRGELTWRYEDFTTLNGKPFPLKMSVALTGMGRDSGFALTLSKLGDSDGWETHTTPSSKYKERDANALFRELMGM